LGPIIPPSIPMIIYAVLAGVSVGGMFLAGIVPGILIAIGLAFVVHLRAGQLDLPRTPRADRRSIVRQTGSASLALLAPFIIVGGIRGGVFTPTEAGAIAAIYVLVIGVAFYRGLGLRSIGGALV